MKIQGQKVYINKGIQECSYEIILRWLADIEVMKYVSFAKRVLEFKNPEQVKSFFEELPDRRSFEIRTNENFLIGYTTLSHFKNDECEFGVFIGEKDYWNKGIGTEATKLILDYGFNKLNLKKITLSTSEFHTNAINLYKKLGFNTAEVKPSARTVYHNNEWIQSGTVIMELTRNFYAKKFCE